MGWKMLIHHAGFRQFELLEENTMATQISNQALLTFVYDGQSGSAVSNIATTTLQGPLTAEKTSLRSQYTRDEEMTYILTMSNTGISPLTGLRVTDNLGTYSLNGISVAPLTYVGPARLYVNGAFISEITPELAADSVSFVLSSLSAGENAMILYTVRINQAAPLAAGSTITNTAVWTADTLAEPVVASHIIQAADRADVSIVKSMSPNPVSGGGQLTYTFMLYNYGNTAATNVVLTDAFFPAPNPISVTVDGQPVSSSEYSYTGGTLTLPAAGSSYSLTIPPAVFSQDPATGAFSATPGVTTIVVQGIL